MKIVIATRRSALALWQARFAAARIGAANPGVVTELLPMSTHGDRNLDTSLAKIGGKGLFIGELEHAIEEGRAHIAVHSMKDVPAELPEGMLIGAVLERADPRDAFVSNAHARLADLPEGAVVGTSSLRRGAQLAALRPDLRIRPLRGNVDTRLRKLDEDDLAAIILACAGLDRLGLTDRIAERLAPDTMLPAIAQGAVGIECREDASDVRAALAPLEHEPTRACVDAERTVNRLLAGSCVSPIAAFAEPCAEGLRLRALVARPDGTDILRAEAHGDDPVALGTAVADTLERAGAKQLLAELAHE